MACDRVNPLTRSGTAQAGRFLPALSTDHFDIDDRDRADLILFARKYARYLTFYDRENKLVGNWGPFFSKDLSTILAGLSKLPVNDFLQFSSQLRLRLLRADQDVAPRVLRSHFKLYFCVPVFLLRILGEHFDELEPTDGFRSALVNILAEAQSALTQVAMVYNALKNAGLLQDTPFNLDDSSTDRNLRDDTFIHIPGSVRRELLRFDQTFSTADFSSGLFERFAVSGWTSFVAGVGFDDTPISNVTTMRRQIREVLNYGLFVNGYARLYQLLQRVADSAASRLAKSLDSDPTHAPNMGLFLSFLKLFDLHKAELNHLTERHLRYYYDDILGFEAHPAEPNHVHVVFEPSKNAKPVLLPLGEVLRAGKDNNSKPVSYALAADIVVNHSVVAELKAVFRKNRITYASPVANSLDGAGEKLAKDYPAWKPFGPYPAAKRGRRGFALADKALSLRDGKRTITIHAILSGAPRRVRANMFRVRLTGENGWFRPTTVTVTKKPGNVLEIVTVLLGGEPAIVPYEEDVHLGGFGTTLPAIKLALRDADDLSHLRVDAITLSATVERSRNFSLQNDAGSLDPSKPFLPFGATPATSNSMILGSPEIFAKQLHSLKLSVKFDEQFVESNNFLVKSASDYSLRISYLDQGSWSKLEDVAMFTTGPSRAVAEAEMSESNYEYSQQYIRNEKQFASKQKRQRGKKKTKKKSSAKHSRKSDPERVLQERTYVLTQSGKLPSNSVPNIKNPPYGTGATSGYLKFAPLQDFGHARYPAELSRIVVGKANVGGYAGDSSIYNYDAAGMPAQPYTPKFTDIYVDYTTAALVPTEYLHLHPFGVSDVPPDAGLVPPAPFKGELYIGLEGVDPAEKVNLLFRVVEGTSNPLKNPALLQWHYLKDDEWQPLKSSAVHDDTLSMTTTGVVGIGIPAHTPTEHRLLPSGYVWLRLAIASDADALCDIVEVLAQGAKATLVAQGNDAEFLATPLPAKTISKLAISNAAITKVVQPDASFGGRAAETDQAFLTRTSERLRHKNRAVTMWDYERLVLESFPEIHRVKCINHTAVRAGPGAGGSEAHGIQPGHVLVVPIARVHDKITDPRRPYTRKSTLIRIKKLLQERASPFVQLDVRNPKIAEVQVKLTPVFDDNILDTGFYQEQVIEELKRFFMPWSRDDDAEPEFGGRWNKAAMINFVEDLPYIDHVKDVEMYLRSDISVPDSSWPRIDVEVIELADPHAILVSHETHDIEVERS